MARATRLFLWPAFMMSGTTPAFATDREYVGTIYLAYLLILLLCYFIPTYVAFFRRHPNRWPIMAINLVLGGTGLGWLGSLIWALGAVHKSPTGNNGGESGLNLFVNDPTIVRIENAGVNLEESLHKLERLKKLHDEGVLSDEEYEEMRRPLVVRLVQ